jgi:hypothetical protein
LTFRYEACTCEDSIGTNTQPDAVCADFENVPTGAVDISCIEAALGTEVMVSPNRVTPGEVILLTMPDGSPLPQQISCRISVSGTGSGTVFQVFSFFTRDGYDLFLNDKFGSFKLLSCSNESGKQLDCDVLICFEYNLTNIGTNELDVSKLERTRNNVTDSLLLQLPSTTVQPNASTVLVEKELVNLCVEANYSISVAVTANSPNGLNCFGNDVYALLIQVPCQVFVLLDCATLDGVACASLTGEQFLTCSCQDGCATELTYRYTGAPCNGLEGCTDFNTNSESANILVQGKGATLFNDIVFMNQSFSLRQGGECLPDKLEVIITPTGTSSPSQTLSVDSSCAGSKTLLETFAGLEFAGYVCEDSTPHNCYADVEYTINTTNVGVVTQTVTSWELTLNGDLILPTVQLPSLNPKDTFSVYEAAEVNLCRESQYSTTANVTATGAANGRVCQDASALAFEISIGAPLQTFGPSSMLTGSQAESLISEQLALFPNSHLTLPPKLNAATRRAPITSPNPTGISETTSVTTSSPTSSPSGEPIPFTATPTGATRLPFRSPTQEQPSGVCEFELEISCINQEGGQSCNMTPPTVNQCTERPFEMAFLFNGKPNLSQTYCTGLFMVHFVSNKTGRPKLGGDCSQSFNVQDDNGNFTCMDQGEGVPTDKGEKAFILVSDLDGKAVLHKDWVMVGTLFTLSNFGNTVPPDQIIAIYNSDDTANTDSLLQVVKYSCSCAQNLFLKDRFGAAQLITWVNEDQGTVSSFANQSFTLEATAPFDIPGFPAILQTLTVSSNIQPFFFNLTDKINGAVIEGGSTMQTVISIPIDLTQKRIYNLLITLSALSKTGQRCNATEFISFTAGYPLPPVFPTFSPTRAPSGIHPPIPDSEACKLEAYIDCRAASGTSCSSLRGPTSMVCASQDGRVTAVEFIVTGGSCGNTGNCVDASPIDDAQVFVVAEGDVVAFQGVVAVGDFVRISNGLETGRLAVTISTVNNGQPGTPLQSLQRIDLGCTGNVSEDLTLHQSFGALQIVGFANADQGLNSILEDITVIYSVKNNGVVSAVVPSATRTSAFEVGPLDMIAVPLLLRADEEIRFEETTTRINLKQETGRDFEFRFDVVGERTESDGQRCENSGYFNFRVR